MSWVSDGSTEISIEGPRVSCKVDESSGSNVYNAIWKDGDGLQSGNKGYWKISLSELKEGNVFAGVTDSNKFKKGWACKGLLYGGNLSNGGALLVGNFGPWMKSGDVLGVFVDVDDSKIRVYFDVNGRSLGLAFNVPRATLGNGIFPVVHFSGSGSVIIVKSEEFPSTTRQEETFEGLLGHWKYSSGTFETGGENPTFEVRGTVNAYKGSLRVINSIHVNITRDGADGPFKGHTGASTMMGGSPEMMRLESEMTQHMTGTFQLNESGQLMISSGGEGDKSSVWSRFTPAKSPVTENPFQ